MILEELCYRICSRACVYLMGTINTR